MIKRLLLRIVVLAVIFDLVAWIVPGIHIHGGIVSLLWIAILFSLVNLVIGPLVRLLSLPVIMVTLGLFLLIINAALLALTAWLSKDLAVDSFGAAILGGLLISVFGWFAELIFPLRSKRD
jgi:putative membrane protein